MAKFNKKKLPSRHTSLGADRAPHRSFYYAMGETEKDVAKPFVGVVSTWNEAAPCNIALMRQAQSVKKGVRASGGTPREFCTITVTDGIAMGHEGMKSSLISREVIADSTELTVRGHCYDALVGIAGCDKSLPALMMAMVRLNVPSVFIYGGSILPGQYKGKDVTVVDVFEAVGKHSAGQMTAKELRKLELVACPSAGACGGQFTANTMACVSEAIGLALPYSAGTPAPYEERDKYALLSGKTVMNLLQKNIRPRDIVTKKSLENAATIVAATGGSTNHTIHLIAMARAAGIIINWDDMSDLSAVIPLITRMYPNGAADVNHFHASGGMGFVIHTLLAHGLLHEDVTTILGNGLTTYTQEPYIVSKTLAWRDGAKESLNDSIIRDASNPFSVDGGIKIIKGNIGRSVVKTAAVSTEHFIIEAPAIVFNEQHELITAFKNNELNKDFIAVLPFQGPAHKGMPELHQLTPTLTILQKKGFRVALVTDGRMSGASGKVPAAIHMSPEASKGGSIGKIKTGDLLTLNCIDGTLTCHESDFEQRATVNKESTDQIGLGRELFGVFRRQVTDSEQGACTLF